MSPLSSNRPIPVYDCKQNELYSVALICWKSYMDNQAAFEAFNTRYTVQFGTDMKAAVQSAKALPDEFQRSDVHKTLRKDLKAAAENALIKWQQLESFINNGFDEEDQESKKLAAGHAYYAAASHEDWESVDSLLSDATTFIGLHIAELTTGGMPATFPGDLGTVKTSFEGLYEAFTDAELDAPEQTDAKINANNELHRNLMKMLDDGQKITRNNAALKSRFTFSHVLELIGGGPTSDSAGYDVQDFFIAPGESVIVAENLPSATDEIYMRVVTGDNAVTVCTTDDNDGLCIAGYVLEPQVTFKGEFGELGLDMTKTKLRVTNPGTEEVLFRGGPKL